MPDRNSILRDLMQVIRDRKTAPPADRPSYVVRLLDGGVPAIGAKIVEEAGEVVEAAGEPGADGQAHLVREVADLVFHGLVLLAHRDLGWEEVEAELARRFGIGGIEEKRGRGAGTGAGAEVSNNQ